MLLWTNCYVLSQSTTATSTTTTNDDDDDGVFNYFDDDDIAWTEINSSNGGTYDQFYETVSKNGTIEETAEYLFTEDVEYVVTKELNIQAAGYVPLGEGSNIGLNLKVNPGVTVTFKTQPNVCLFVTYPIQDDTGTYSYVSYVSIKAGGDWGDLTFSGAGNTATFGYQNAFFIQDTTNIQIEGATFTNFNNLDYINPSYAAPITLSQAFATLKNVTFTGNKGVVSSAIYSYMSNIEMDNVLVQKSSVLTSPEDIRAKSDASYSNAGQFYSFNSDNSGYYGSATFSGNTGQNIACYKQLICSINPNIVTYDDDDESDATPSDPSDASTSNSNSSHSKTGEVYAATISGAVLIIAVVAVVISRRRRQQVKDKELNLEQQLVNAEIGTPYSQL